MDIITSIFSCLGHRQSSYRALDNSDLNEKLYTDADPEVEDAAADFVLTFSQLKAHEPLPTIGSKYLVLNPNGDLQTYVYANGWTESLAQAILYKLAQALATKDSAIFSQAVQDAIKKVYEEAKEFAHDHPEFMVLIALGILVEFTPWVLGALGFGELGIVEGSFAALWQARFAGFVPKGSLFSFLQRCGMVLKHW